MKSNSILHHHTPKTSLVLALLGWAALSASAQVTVDVLFSNAGPGLNAPIYDVDGVTGLYGPQFYVELVYDATPIGGSSPTSLPPSSQLVAPGYFNGGTKEVTGFTPNTTLTLWVRAWNSGTGTDYDSATVRGISNPVSLTVPTAPPPGYPPNPPLALTGLQSFQLQVVPEPMQAMAVTAALCGGFVVLRRLRRVCARGSD